MLVPASTPALSSSHRPVVTSGLHLRSPANSATVNGLQLDRAFLNSSPSKRLTALPHIHPFMHTVTHRRRSQPRRATASWSGAVRVRRLAQGHLDTLGEAGDRTSDLLVTSPPALPPDKFTLMWAFISCRLECSLSGQQKLKLVQHFPAV